MQCRKTSCRFVVVAAFLTVPLRPGGAAELQTFQSPTGNIHCLIATEPAEAAVASCEVQAFTGSIPPRPKDCDLDWVPGASVDGKGKVHLFSCQGDTLVDPHHKILAYDTAITHGGFRCSASRTGITCKAKSGHGFLVSRAVIKKL